MLEIDVTAHSPDELSQVSTVLEWMVR
ncbi:hypothetical protein SMALA_7898 [Streptomyces malaysiensis subsp. malaysiensis]|nr:hypothetical protein SMALA_7898 [Streptomyces malaysiensis]